MRVLAMTTMRNEAPFVLEWIAYHQQIGVTDFLIYTNDCDDGTDLLLDRLAALGVVHHERNHSGGKKPVQWRALTKAQRHPAVAAADWIYVTDVDEFLNIHAGDGLISDLFAAAPDASGFALPWRMFGNAGVDRFHDVPVMEQFKKAAPSALLWPWRAVQCKSLFRADIGYDKLGVHIPKFANPTLRGQWVDGNSGILPRNFNGFNGTIKPRYDVAQINHYALGSMENFLIKVQRGRPNHSNDPIDLPYWLDRNFAHETDDSILRHMPAVEAGIARLKHDPEVARLHDASVKWRHAQIERTLNTEAGFNLYAQLRQMPATKVLPMRQQQDLLNQLITVRRLADQRVTPHGETKGD